MATNSFVDRRQAGRMLVDKLNSLDKQNSVILALPRGGVETAVEIANNFKAPLDLVIARKIGHPNDPEYAIGAVTETGPAIWNETVKPSLDELWRIQAEAKERNEAKRRRQIYSANRTPVPLEGKTVVIVDDGIATGLTMEAAVKQVKLSRPAKIIVATPVAPSDTISSLLKDVNEVITLNDPDEYLGSVGAYYQNFPQLSDEDVITLLQEAEPL